MNEEFQNILEKVRGLYLKYGIKSITMDDVSRELGISKKTLYQYVCDKTELVAKVLDLDEYKINCDFDKNERTEKNAILEMIEFYGHVNKMIKDSNPSTIYDLKKYYPELYHHYMDVRRTKMYEKILANIKKGKKQGIYRTDLDESFISKLIVSTAEKIKDADSYNFEELTLPKFFREFFIYHIRGIANAKGIKLLEENINDFALINNE
jgi:AcrR family transcriptional regulator